MYLCEGCIRWASESNRVFLRQALQARLVAVHLDAGDYTAALSIAMTLLKELKKIDDKALLVEVRNFRNVTFSEQQLNPFY